MARIRRLAAELREKCDSLDDEKVRVRCRRIALEIAGLIEVESKHRLGTNVIAESRAVSAQAETAIRASRQMGVRESWP